MKRILMIMAIATSILATFSCEKYDDGKPSKDVRTEFNKRYPSARDVEWDWEGNYWEVSFEIGTGLNAKEYEAWFDTNGNWIKTKSDRLITEIPQKIKDILAADPTYGKAPYADNDVDYIESHKGNFYRFDLMVNGTVIEIDVNENGEVGIAKHEF